VLEETLRCTLCGTAEWEWEHDKRAYAPVEEFCMGCYLKSVFTDDLGPGASIGLAPTGTVEHAKRLVAEKRRAVR
jgi:hypothetical protein